MRFKMLIFGRTVDVYLQKTEPKWFTSKWSHLKSSGYGFWGSHLGDCRIWIESGKPCKCMVDTFRHEVGHTMAYLQYRYELERGDHRESEEAADLYACTLAEYDRGLEIIKATLQGEGK